MSTTALLDALEISLADRRLLHHPFYRRWSQGNVGLEELRSYAGQYRHFEAAMPGWLSATRERLSDNRVRSVVERNLADEAEGETTHLELFDRFAAALGAADVVPPSPAMRRLLTTYDELVEAGPVTALAAILAYEEQSPEVSTTKADGLEHHLGLGDDGLAFWKTHAQVDASHARWLLDGLAALDAPAGEVEAAARRAAQAWWRFLDEREALRPVA